MTLWKIFAVDTQFKQLRKRIIIIIMNIAIIIAIKAQLNRLNNRKRDILVLGPDIMFLKSGNITLLVTGFVPRLWVNDVMKDLRGWCAI